MAGTVISSAAVNDDFSDIASALTGSLARNGDGGMIGQFKAIDGSIITPSISFLNDLNTGFYRPTDDQIGVVVGGVQVGLFTSGGLQGTIPIGCVLNYGGSTVPTLWAFCYGQAVSRTTYALLFAIIGTTYGSGDGVTTFNLPDCRGVTIVGKDDMGGVAAGRLNSTYFGTAPTVLGNFGGSQSTSLSTPNLPAYTPAGTNGAISVTSTIANILRSTTHDNYTSVAGDAGFIQNVTNGTVTSTGAGPVFTGTAQGGTSVAFSIVQPSLVMNEIIYAGV